MSERNKSVTISGSRLTLGARELELRLTPRARRAMAALTASLDIEMELYFSCLLRKRVRFLDQPHGDVAARASINDKVSVSFRPVMTKVCRVAEVDGAPDIEVLPLVRASAFTPRWLAIDYHDGWHGEFGFDTNP